MRKVGSDDLYKKRKGIGGYITREKEKKVIQNRILIVCEGEKTEPLYFRSYPIRKGEIQVEIEGIGRNTLSLVNKAVELKSEAIKNKKPYNQVWCIFDKDDFPAYNFDNAIHKAMANNLRLGFSNEAFELWFLLHFEYYNNPISRKDYQAILSKLLGKRYEKNDPEIYKRIYKNQEKALENANKLYETKILEGLPFSKCNPITSVHFLVEELNRWI